MKTLKFTMQTIEFFKSVSEIAMELHIQNSEGCVMKQYELIVFMIVFVKAEFQEKKR